MKLDWKAIGQRIRARREELGMGRIDLAVKANVSMRLIDLIETDDTTWFRRVVEALNLSVDDICRAEETTPTPTGFEVEDGFVVAGGADASFKAFTAETTYTTDGRNVTVQGDLIAYAVKHSLTLHHVLAMIETRKLIDRGEENLWRAIDLLCR